MGRPNLEMVIGSRLRKAPLQSWRNVDPSRGQFTPMFQSTTLLLSGAALIMTKDSADFLLHFVNDSNTHQVKSL
jgi:hypothetical protein